MLSLTISFNNSIHPSNTGNCSSNGSGNGNDNGNNNNIFIHAWKYIFKKK